MKGNKKVPLKVKQVTRALFMLSGIPVTYFTGNHMRTISTIIRGMFFNEETFNKINALAESIDIEMTKKEDNG